MNSTNELCRPLKGFVIISHYLRALFTLLLLGIAMSFPGQKASGQAVSIDFNTPGQLTNNFSVRGRVSGQPAVWYEVSNGGLTNSGALDGTQNISPFSTVTYTKDSFPFPLNDGATLNMSIMFKGKQPFTNLIGTQMLLGFLDNGTNALLMATNNYFEGNSPANWMNVRTKVTAQNTNFAMEYGTYITTNLGTNFIYNNFSTLGLAYSTNAFTNWYRLTASFTRTNLTNVLFGGGLQDMGPAGITPSTNLQGMTIVSPLIVHTLALGTNLYAGFLGLETAGIDLIDNFMVWMTNGPATITTQPATQSQSTFQRANLSVRVDGTPPFTFQWYTNGVAVTGSNGPTYTPFLTGPDVIAVKVAVTNGLGGLESGIATLTVTNDITAPTVVSAGSLDGASVGVRFSETVDPATATTIANYSVSGGVVTSATLRPDGQNVKLTL
ncbi:MAG TPA: hypothetical protein VGE41_13725, partial [Verrucomicrobiae bacterium]